MFDLHISPKINFEVEVIISQGSGQNFIDHMTIISNL